MKSASNNPNNTLPEFVPHAAGSLRQLLTVLGKHGVGEMARQGYSGRVDPVDPAVLHQRILDAPRGVTDVHADVHADAHIFTSLPRAGRVRADRRLANPWAADLHDRARARGHDHAHAVRILGRAWLHVIWHC